MRTEASLRRLAEMGVDVYVPRGARGAVDVASPVSVAPSAAADSPRGSDMVAAATAETPATAMVLLLAETGSRGATALLADVRRTLVFARIPCAHVSSGDESAIVTASALVMFGDGQARVVGALLPAQRQREIGWVVSVELSRLAGDAQAKRALWSELKRMARELADDAGRLLAAGASGDDHRVH
jgi:DNA polymerase III psi subunit